MTTSEDSDITSTEEFGVNLVMTDKYLLAYVKQKAENEKRGLGSKHTNSLRELLTTAQDAGGL